MAQKSTIAKVRLNVSDLDRNFFDDYSLAVARHPSETESRMMLRIAAFAAHAHDRLEFGRGISTDNEPDIWLRELTGDIALWIELGTPDPDRLRKACGRAERVVLYAYGERAVKVWWEKHAPALERFRNLEVFSLHDAQCAELSDLSGPNMELQCTISDGEWFITDGTQTVAVKPQSLR